MKPSFLAGTSAGAIAALVVVGLMAIARWVGITSTDAEVYLGALVTQETGAGTWLLGLVMFVVLGALAGLLYALILRSVQPSRTGRAGAAIGLVQAIVVGIALAFVPVLHPAVPDELPSPGAFAVHLGALTALTFVVLHVLFGLVVGRFYARGRRLV